MKQSFTVAVWTLALALAGWISVVNSADRQPADAKKGKTMRLGAFSISLAVKDLAASRAFYEKLGFSQLAGDGKSYIILKNESTVIGLFQGILDKNTLTFNPGWDQNAKPLPAFEDVRDLQKRVKAAGITPVKAAKEGATGPDHFILADPDGNPIFFDQHVPKPAK